MKVALPHRKGIDGLRAVAVSAVLLYHAEMDWLPGGFLGVDVFFVISGYLITSLLVAELAATGRISLRQFWLRRARRLLPAVGALLVVVIVAALLAASDSVARLRGDVVAALAYASNWWQIVRGESYFESFGRPPLLRHLWSLAVEEQLYVLAPLALAWLGRRPSFRPQRVAAGALALSVASMALFAALWDAHDPSRAWFGTDTRAAGLLLGLAIALRWPLDQQRRWTGSARRALDVVGTAALAGLVIIMATVGDLDAALPRFGYPVGVVLAGVLVAAASHRSSMLGRILGVRPLVWLGTRSYAVYLWHWPVYVLTRPEADVSLRGWPLHAMRFAIIGALAEVSWRLVEQPWRTGAVGRAWRTMRVDARRRVALVGAGVTTALVAGLGVGLASGEPPPPPELLATVAISPTTATTLARVPGATTTTTATTAVAPVTTTAPDPQVGPVLAVGDSVMLSARDALVRGSSNRVLVDAATGRQVDDGLDVLQRYRDAGTFGQVSAVVVHLGTNGPMSAPQFDRLAMIVSGVPHVVVVNVRVSKPWEAESNASINAGVPRSPAMRLADWHAASADPALLVDDGVHPTYEGARVYTDTLMQQLRGAPPPPTTTTAPPPPPPTTQPPPSTTTTAPPSPIPTLGG